MESQDKSLRSARNETDSFAPAIGVRPYWIGISIRDQLPIPGAAIPYEMTSHDRGVSEGSRDESKMNLTEFIENRFIPEHVAHKRLAGRSHFQAMLKHVLTPVQVDRAFGVRGDNSKLKRTESADWPYMDRMRLCDVTEERIQNLISVALRRGYSIQTATHIRNVIRSIFTHAKRSGVFSGKNPATLVTLPVMARKEAYSLSLDQLRDVIRLMRYPEREIALVAILTEMSVAEICGLKWKYVNFSDGRRSVDGEWLFPRTIAIRNQSYRAKLFSVMEVRQRNVPIPDLLCSAFRDLRSRPRFTGPEDFALASRNGTPISQDNLAARRLKAIGRSVGMPWLSWLVFHRTHVALTSQFGTHLQDELRQVVPTGAA
jgi:integrase